MQAFNLEQSERISPFRGIRYNQRMIGDLAKITCPPYDVITLEQQKIYYQRSDYNAIRLEYMMEQPGDDAADNKYMRAATTFRQWLKRGILQVDDYPAFYLHDRYFTYLGKERVQRGLVARVKLAPWGDGIYPHEETTSTAKSDRLQLMQACRANISSLFTLYQDLGGEVTSILDKMAQGSPIISLRSVEALSEAKEKAVNLPDSGEGHTVWAITDQKLKQQLGRLLSACPLYLADGHHRYETALAYQQERMRELPHATGEEAFNYVMMTLVEFSDPGLVIFPIHRLVRGIGSSALAGLKKQLEKLFTLEFIPLAEVLSCYPGGNEESHPFTGIQDMVLGILGLESHSLVVLKQRQDMPVETIVPGNHSQAYKRFSISLLDHVILDRMLGVEAGEESIAYVVDVDEAYQQVSEGKYQLAFLSNPPRPEMIKVVADAKDRMPRKSTYFYPKLPTGLIINPLD